MSNTIKYKNQCYDVKQVLEEFKQLLPQVERTRRILLKFLRLNVDKLSAVLRRKAELGYLSDVKNYQLISEVERLLSDK